VRAIAVDVNGNAYVMGDTDSAVFPVKRGFQPAFGGGPTDAFLVRISAPDDFAITKVVAPKALKQGKAPSRAVKVEMQNRSGHRETVAAGNLGDGVTIGFVRLAVSDDDDETCAAAAVALDATKNAKLFAKGPKTLKPTGKLKLVYLIRRARATPHRTLHAVASSLKRASSRYGKRKGGDK
jgi:hypothetical protein